MSSHVGHHAWVELENEEIKFNDPRKNPLPAFAHLLLTADEMRAALHDITSSRLAEVLVESVYESDGLNRFFFGEYEALFAASPFEVLSLVPASDPVDSDLAQILRFRFPSEQHFNVTNIEILMQKNRL